MGNDHFTPSIDEARQAYELLTTRFEVGVIQRRLGLDSTLYVIDAIVASPARRVRLVNWAKTVGVIDSRDELRPLR